MPKLTNDEQEHMARAKAWCFDNQITEDQITAAWNRALRDGLFLVKNFATHGHTWWRLPPHLLKELINRYPKEAQP